MLDFLKRVLQPVFALAFILLGVMGFAGLWSYNPFDPSWDFSTQAEIKNWAGIVGANLATLHLSFVGYTGYFASFVFFIWGIKLMKHSIQPTAPEEIPWFKGAYAKAFFFFLSLIFISGALSSIDDIRKIPEAWVNSSHGGHLGFFLRQSLSEIVGYPVFIGLFSVFGFIMGLLAIGLSIETWMKIFIIAYSVVVSSFVFIYQKLVGTYKYLRKLFGREVQEDILEQEVVETPKKSRKIVSKEKTKKNVEKQASFDLNMSGDFQLPPLSLLELPEDTKAKQPSESSLSANAEMLEKVLDDFGVKGKIIEVQPGPVVTLYSFEPAPGTKSSRVIGLSDDIARSMTATSARISVIPGVNAIGIELPNSFREKVYLKELMLDNEFKKTKAALPLILGKDIAGRGVVIDLARTPHLLVAGTTGSGKSVGLNAMILSLLYKYSPDECKFIMIDPKMLELSVYQDIPHLLSPVVTEPQKAIVALKWW
jgi:S-DNA-T family DNA segregation ATPase FtsK/SpoIIIE